ncbi:MAG TPA: hypothetical protein VLF40_03365 [Candidatus Saccharimonadales bacterium]|nr:hypothetical protein [Candidatus Saccharimonadales bacterium]
MKPIAKNTFQSALLVYLVGLAGFWLWLRHSGYQTSNYNYAYSLLFSLQPLIGGLIGMVRSGIWGRFKSAIGKSVFFFSLGLLLWGAGSMVWSYYNFIVKNSLPYPSLADLGFAPSIFFWGLGAVFLSKASGARFAFRTSMFAKFFVAAAVVLLPAAAYYLLVHVARGGVVVPEGESSLKTVLDVAYPLGDFVALMLSVIIFGLSMRYFGGYFRLSIISLLAGLAVMFLADFVFSYTTTTGTFYNGDWGDLLLTFGLFLLTYGVLGFASRPKVKLASSSGPETSKA